MCKRLWIRPELLHQCGQARAQLADLNVDGPSQPLGHFPHELVGLDFFHAYARRRDW